ncbi:MAG: DUF11 domain-containing protein [Ignavibacteriales bacterium]|nr:DUF11 domain-containing protein [Ignavibacteriales bacterium]
MKKILIVLCIAASYIFAQGTALKVYDYQINANTLLKLKSGKTGFITMKPAKNAKDENAFGYWISNNTNANAVFLEVKEGEKSILSVTAKDFAAKAKYQGAVATYKSGSGANSVEVTVESSSESDASMPLAKSINIVVKAKVSGSKNLSAVMTLYGDGFVRKVGTNGVATSKVEKGKAVYPLVVITGKAGTSVTTDAGEQKAPGKLVRLSSASPVSGTDATLLSFVVNGTTVKDYEKSVQQAVNIDKSVTEKKESTELAIFNTANNMNPFPGDTVTYTIQYHNIGNAFAQDVVISNPIPEGMIYVGGSAAGDNAEITLDRKEVAAPQQGDVAAVRWTIKKRILPGEEGSVTMKAIVR